MNFILFFDNIFESLRSLYYTFLFCCTIFLLGACSVTRNLNEDEYLLSKVSVKGNKKVNKEALLEIVKQTPNRKIAGAMPYLSIYNFGRKFYDTTKVSKEIARAEKKYTDKIEHAGTDKKKEKYTLRKEKKLEKLNQKKEDGNWLMRVPGEPPVIYDSASTSQSTRHMSYYVKSQGFFRGYVVSSTDTVGKKIKVRYKVSEGKGYYVKGFSYILPEKNREERAIDSIVQANFHHSHIKTGERYNEEYLSAERERVNELLKNEGYYDFSRQYIFFNVDTIQEPYSVYLSLIIENAKDKKEHQQYFVNKIIFDADVTEKKSFDTDTISYKNIDFILYGNNYSKRILENKIKIKYRKLYRIKDIQATQRHLATLDMFKFININYEKDRQDSTGNSLIAYIRTSPLKKFQITDEWGLTVATQAFVPGPFANINFKTRNVFGGFEVLDINLKASAEGYSSFSDPNNVLRTQEFSGNTGLTFAEILFPFSKIRDLLKDYSPRTKVAGGASLTKRPEYDRLIINSSYQYAWFTGQYSTYTFSLIDVNIINTLRKERAFVEYLENLHNNYGSNLIYSFNNSFVSNSNISYIYNDNQLNQNKNSSYVKLYAEPGGTIFNIPNLAPQDSIFGLKTYRYLRGSVDLRKYFPLSKKSTFAVRLNVGAVYAYDATGALPYEKFYFAGGSNSIRAWKPRRLGPGSYVDRNNEGEPQYNFEQPGEFLIENSYEYRFNITGFIDGALFIDAGNIWTLHRESSYSRPGSLLQANTFLQQIAVGSGFGIRLNFSFLILRFDIGIKTIDPSRPKGERFVLPELFDAPPFGPKNLTAFNIGIGYPF